MALPILDERLNEIASLVRKQKVTCDVGTDHGYLITYLVGNNIAQKGYACDINEKPLESAKATIERSGLSDKIECVLTNGLIGLENNQIEEIIIAGMGGDLISMIIENSPFIMSNNIHLVLQPMTKSEHLRIYLAKKGFEIELERAVISGRFVYSVMSVYFTGVKRDIDELESFIGKVREGSSPHTKAYLKRIADNLKERADGISKSDTNSEKATTYYDMYNKIQGFYEEE